MNKHEKPVPGYVAPRSLGDPDVQRMIESAVPEWEAREVVMYDYVVGDERTYGDEISPVTIDLLDIAEIPEWAKGSEPSIEHAVEVALQKRPGSVRPLRLCGMARSRGWAGRTMGRRAGCRRAGARAAKVGVIHRR